MPYQRRKDDIHNLPHLAEYRDELRKQLTPAEASLWNMLKNSQLEGRKFRRQHSVGNYILDFYCPSEKLAIELDGARHFSGRGAAEDRERTAYLESKGILVIRFENKQVFDERDWVADMIRDSFRFGPPAPTKYYRNARPTNDES
jgi:very-short-patch-repair endonuclease